MKKIALLLFLSLLCSAHSAAQDLKPANKIAGFNPVNLDRWQEIHRTNEAILYFDKQTVHKQAVPMLRQAGGGPPVTYTFWVKSFTRSHEMTEPKQVTLPCYDSNGIPPESSTEKFYQFFCLSPDAQQTVYIDPAIEQAKQSEARQKAQQEQTNQQLQAAQKKAAYQNLIMQGSGLVNLLRRY